MNMNGALFRTALVCILLVVVASGVGCEKAVNTPGNQTIIPIEPIKYIAIMGTVSDQSGAMVSGIEVKLFTYHPDPRFEYFPPIGHVIGSGITDEKGSYHIEIDAEVLQRLFKFGYNKLVVFVTPGVGGWKVIELKEGIVEVDLVVGTPAPSH